jgi:hypothetical protein
VKCGKDGDSNLGRSITLLFQALRAFHQLTYTNTGTAPHNQVTNVSLQILSD